MVGFFRRILNRWRQAPPDRRNQRVFAAFVLVFLVLDLTFLIPGQTQAFEGSTWVFAGVAVCLVLFFVWVLRGGLRGPSWFFLVVLVMALTYLTTVTGGVYSNGLLFFIPLILLASGLVGWQGGVALTLGALVLLWSTYLFLPGSLSRAPAPPYQVRNLTVILGAVLIFVLWYRAVLKVASDRLQAANQELEERVRVRTEQVLASEKLSTLGRLSAGLAHELNTPLAAICSVTETSSVYMKDRFLADLGTFASLDGPTRDRLTALLHRCLEAILGPQILAVSSSLERREAVKANREALLSLGVAPDLAHRLADLGGVLHPRGFVDEADLWIGPQAWEIAGFLEGVLGLFQSQQVVGVAAEKAAGVVRVLHLQSRVGHRTAFVPVDLAAEFGAVLPIFQTQLRGGVTLVQDCPVPIEALATREGVGQILINLISNALQSMAGRGVLELATGQDGGTAWAEVRDSGPGIPPEVQDRIFQPFFTTKAPGEGNGLGLDICLRLARDFGGDLTFTSVPGRTIFRLSIPAVQR